jgi:DNA relaxase NicK
MVKSKNECSLLDVGIDWLTVTLQVGLKSRFAAAKAERLMLEWESKGAERKPTNRLGFIGDRIDGLFYGIRGDTLMVILSGDLAHKHAAFFLGMAEHVTRLDVAATLQDTDTERDWTALALREVSQIGVVESGLMKTHRIVGTPDGKTLYVGSRSSDRYIRIYDKTAESKGDWPQRSWRWEIEYKRPRSGVVARRLLENGVSDRACLDILKSAFEGLNITLPCRAPSSGWVPKRPRLTTTTDTRLKYAHRVVRPFLKGLIESVGEDRVIEALEGSLFSERRLKSDDAEEISH